MLNTPKVSWVASKTLFLQWTIHGSHSLSLDVFTGELKNCQISEDNQGQTAVPHTSSNH